MQQAPPGLGGASPAPGRLPPEPAADPSRTLAHYRALVEAEPHNAKAWTCLGALYAAAARHAESALAFEGAVRAHPDSGGAWYNLGRALASGARNSEAAMAFESATRLAPTYAPAYLAWAEVLFPTADRGALLQVFERAARAGCRDVALLIGHGAALERLGRHADALERFEAARTLHPELPEVDFNRGVSLAALGRHEEALDALSAALTRRPEYAEARVNRGISLAALGRHQEALEDIRPVLASQPALAIAQRAAGISALALGELPAAVEHLRTALTLDARDARAWEALGDAYTVARAHTAALECHQHGLKLLDQAAEPLAARAWILNKCVESLLYLGDFSGAQRAAGRLLALDPEFPYALGHQLYAAAWTGDWGTFEGQRAGVLGALREGRASILPFPLLAICDDPALQRSCAEAFVARHHPQATRAAAPARSRRPGRVRIAYVSPDFREHPVAYLIAPTIEAHDRTRFEVLAVSTAASPEATTTHRRLRAAFDDYLDASLVPDDGVADWLGARGVDIAVDLAGHTTGGRPGILARHPAEVQVNFLGYPGTSGAKYIDYIIADQYVVPPSLEHHYTERIARLAGSLIPPGDLRSASVAPAARAERALDGDRVVLGAFHNAYKIMPELFSCWLRILSAAPRAVLRISVHEAAAQASFRLTAEASGIDPDRLKFAPRVAGHAEHRARVAAADLLLDTFPYNAHSSAAEALAAGVPVVSLSGTSFASRVGAGLLRALGLPELATDSLEDYEALTVRLARAPEVLAALQARVRDAVATSAVFDPRAYTRGLETAYLTMWERAQNGQPPASFSLPAS